jgi:hypothetical protein
MAAQNAQFEEKVYEQAGEWVRLGNTITWTTGALFIPLALGALPIAMGMTDAGARAAGDIRKVSVLAIASILLYLLWVYIAWLYRVSVMQAREVMIRIEEAQSVPVDRSLYRIQGQPSKRGLSLAGVQYLTGLALVLIWGIYLAMLFRR